MGRNNCHFTVKRNKKEQGKNILIPRHRNIGGYYAQYMGRGYQYD